MGGGGGGGPVSPVAATLPRHHIFHSAVGGRLESYIVFCFGVL